MSEVEKLSALKQTFDALFLNTYCTRLTFGHKEPFYRAARGNEPAEIQSREDFLSSALHEIAHWCVAGEARRKLDDFGYWYEPDGRSLEQQVEFERVEVKPQAIEWALSLAMNHDFHFSADNLGAAVGPSEAFKQNVYQQLTTYWTEGLPKRAQLLFDALVDRYRSGVNPALPILDLNQNKQEVAFADTYSESCPSCSSQSQREHSCLQ